MPLITGLRRLAPRKGLPNPRPLLRRVSLRTFSGMRKRALTPHLYTGWCRIGALAIVSLSRNFHNWNWKSASKEIRTSQQQKSGWQICQGSWAGCLHSAFFARCCLGKVPGGAPFSQRWRQYRKDRPNHANLQQKHSNKFVAATNS